MIMNLCRRRLDANRDSQCSTAQVSIKTDCPLYRTPFQYHLSPPSTLIASGIVLAAPISSSDQPPILRRFFLNFSANNSPAPAPSMPRVPAIRNISGTVSLRFFIVQHLLESKFTPVYCHPRVK